MSVFRYFFQPRQSHRPSAIDAEIAELQSTVVAAQRRIDSERVHPMEKYWLRQSLKRALDRHDQLVARRAKLEREERIAKAIRPRVPDVAGHPYHPMTTRKASKPLPLGVPAPNRFDWH